VKVLLVGVGTVGEAIVRLSRNAPWLERLVCADYDVGRARRVRDAAGADESTHPAIALDASSQAAIVEAIRAHDVDIVVNAVDPRFVMPIFDAALEADVDYLDMAMSLSQPHPDRPHEAPGTMLGDVQFGRDAQWRERGRLALCGMGMDPGLSDVFATYAARHLFDEVHAVRIRDGGDLRVEGHAFAPVFSIWTTIEECLNPPLIWEKERGWFTTEPFSEPERFVFPDGIGPVECVNVEHEEVVLVPRWLDVRRVDFKYALGEDFIGVLKTLHRLGLDRTDKVDVRGVQVAPRDLVGALTPDPATLGDAFVGRAVVGAWVTGVRDGAPREVYLYQQCDAQETLRKHGLQPVAWQTGFNPVLALELLAERVWSGAGVLGPEAFDPDAYLALMDRSGIHHAMMEIEPGTATA
jgi:saccharopine dehydrogenase-like NADP-dependent oxidoreductase